MHNQAKPELKRDLRKIICVNPFVHLEIQEDGTILQCCKTWMPRSLGNILRTSIHEAYWGERAEAGRRSVQDGSFRFCNHITCPYLGKFLHSGEAGGPIKLKDHVDYAPHPNSEEFYLDLALNYDRSCNLYCPSCRGEKILFRAGELPPVVDRIHQEVKKNITELRKVGIKLRLYVTGGGDAFASPTFYKMLAEMPYDPGIQLAIKTNGVLMTAHRFTDAMKKMISAISVSVDAFTSQTYSKVRKGGSFEAMRANIGWLDQAIRQGKFPALKEFHLNFVVQKDNYEEMADFARWATSYASVNQVFFHLIRDWNSVSKKAFNDKAVWMRGHPEYPRLVKAAQHPFLCSDPRVHLGDLSRFSLPTLAPNSPTSHRVLFRFKQALPIWGILHRALGSVSWTTNQLRTSHGRSAFVARWKRRLHLGVSTSRR
jgi:MoaA/NifB/PqqE/SkfB family radical SAM enzyme